MENGSNNIFLVKLGGSLIAPKGTTQFNGAWLQSIATFINSIQSTKKIVINGTGHFGHGAVKKYGVSEENFMRIQAILHNYFTKVDTYFPEFTRLSGRRIYQGTTTKEILDGFDSIILGGGITTNETISSEKIFAQCQKRYTPAISYMITDVPGVYDKEGNIIPIINKNNIDTLHFYHKEGDASGGMKEKIEQIQSLSQWYSGKTRIIDGNNKENIRQVIETDTGIGTQVYF